jgi:hypothetical protein
MNARRTPLLTIPQTVGSKLISTFNMKFTNMKKLIFYILTYLMIVSCFGLIEEPDEYYHLNQNAKNIADFKIGSFWIYHSDSLNTNDTVSVIEYLAYQVEYPVDLIWQYYDKVEITLNSTYWDCFIHDILEARYPDYADYSRSYCRPHIDNRLGFRFDILHDNSFNTSFGNIQYIDNFNLNGFIINNVMIYTADDEYDSYVQNTKFYFASNYGLIKMELLGDSIVSDWTLIEYNIVQ